MFTMKATNKQQLAFLFKKNFSPSFDYSTLLGVENRGGNKAKGSRIRTLVRPAVARASVSVEEKRCLPLVAFVKSV
jgi:hypothetical protein